MKHYWNVYKVFIANAFSYDAQYRSDAWLKVVISLLQVGLMFLTIDIVFSQTSSIAGWTKAEVYLMTLLLTMADELGTALFSQIGYIPNIIAEGDLDFYLLRPINSIFLITCKYILLRAAYRFLSLIPVLVWVLFKFDFKITLSNGILGLLMFIISVFVVYSFTLIANTFSFWFPRIDNVSDAILTIKDFSRFPLDIWPKTIKILFLTAIPIAFSGFMPAATFVGKWPWYGILYAVIFCIVLFTIAVKFWNFALKRYSSASS